MTIDTTPARSRRLRRTTAVSLGLALGSLAAPAYAAPPDTWPEPDNGSTLEQLLWLVGVPIAIILLITLLVYLPSMMKRQSTEPALAFRDRPEWFGGPRKGVSGTATTATTEPTDSSAKGGASARW